MKTENNKLIIGDIPASEIAKKYGTPIYVYDEEIIRQRFRELNESIDYKPLNINYACKANTNIEIMKILREEGSRIDAVSEGEIRAALKAGFKSEEIVLTSNNITNEEMRFAIEQKILINVDSLDQLDRYGKLNPGSKVAVRINPDVGAGHHDHCITGGPESKFGIYYDKIDEIKKTAEKHKLKIIGVHEHIGTGIMETEKFLLAMNVLLKTAKEFPELEFVDFGGGIGIPYRKDRGRINMKEFGKKVSDLFRQFCREYGKGLAMAIEPGRYLVAESGFLLCEINTIKDTQAHKFVGVNTGFNHLIRPTMYGSYHHIIKCDEVEGESEEAVICGNICESGDVFTRTEKGNEDRKLPKLKHGDILAICDAGAYGYSMASNYNTRPRPAEILVKGKETRLIRPAETYEEIIN